MTSVIFQLNIENICIFNPAFSVIFIQHFGYFGNIEVHLNVWTLYNNQW